MAQFVWYLWADQEFSLQPVKKLNIQSFSMLDISVFKGIFGTSPGGGRKWNV